LVKLRLLHRQRYVRLRSLLWQPQKALLLLMLPRLMRLLLLQPLLPLLVLLLLLPLLLPVSRVLRLLWRRVGSLMVRAAQLWKLGLLRWQHCLDLSSLLRQL